MAPRSGAFLKHLGVHGVFGEAPENTNAKTRAASIPRALGTECMLRQKPKCISRVGPVQVDAYLSAGRSNSSRAFKARLLFRAPAQCLPITLNSLRSVSVSLCRARTYTTADQPLQAHSHHCRTAPALRPYRPWPVCTRLRRFRRRTGCASAAAVRRKRCCPAAGDTLNAHS